MTPHRIRLGPPWLVTEGPEAFRHTRRFGRPRTLGPGDRVWLVVGPCPGHGSVFVNGEAVGRTGPTLAADITPLLRPRNELVIVAPTAAIPDGAALEIRTADARDDAPRA